jgi:hypothetical protein
MSIAEEHPADKDWDWEQEKPLWEAEKKGALSKEAVTIDEFLDRIPSLREAAKLLTYNIIRKQRKF